MTTTAADRSEAIAKGGLAWMPKSVWGPIKWKELHIRGLVSLPLADEETWFAAFLAGLPCPECRHHFEEFLLQAPPNFRTREGFFLWTVRAHNFVNQSMGKPRFSVSEALVMHQLPLNAGD